MNEIEELLYEFWSGFGVPAFLYNTVPKGQTRPFLTYTYSHEGMFSKSSEFAIIWTYSDSFFPLDRITECIVEAIPPEGLLMTLPNDLGTIKIIRGKPFTQHQRDDDYMVKARIINYTITNYTA